MRLNRGEEVLRLAKPTVIVTTLAGRWGAWEFPTDTRVIRVRYYRWLDFTVSYVHTHEGWAKALYCGRLPLTREDLPCRSSSAAAAGNPARRTPKIAPEPPT